MANQKKKRKYRRSVKKPLTKLISVRFPAVDFAKVQDHALDLRLPVATVVRNIVLDYIEDV